MAITKIPEMNTHRGLKTGLNAIRAEVESRQEDVDNLEAFSAELAERVHNMIEELQGLNVDTATIGNVTMLSDGAASQQEYAKDYKNATDTSVNQAEVAARTAHRNHGRIQDAVDDSGLEKMATNRFYDAE